jgi:hypothetical protein
MRQVVSILLLSLLVVGGAVFLAGCGSGAEEKAATFHILTKSQLISEVEAICRKGDKERFEGLEAAAKRGEDVFESSPEGLEKLVVDVLLPAFTNVISQLDELRPAPEQEKVLTEILGDYEAAMEEAEADPGKVVNENPFKAGDKVARSYGIKGCRLGA